MAASTADRYPDELVPGLGLKYMSDAPGTWGLQSIKRYVLDEAIGEGTYGKVFKGRDKLRDGRQVALKRMNRHHEEEGFPKTETREIKILKSVRHPNMVNLIEVVTSLGVEETSPAATPGAGAGGSSSSRSSSAAAGSSASIGGGVAGAPSSAAAAASSSSSATSAAAAGGGGGATTAALGDRTGDIYMVFEYVDYDLAGLMAEGYK